MQPPGPIRFRAIVAAQNSPRDLSLLVQRGNSWSQRQRQKFLEGVRYHKVHEPILEQLRASQLERSWLGEELREAVQLNGQQRSRVEETREIASGIFQANQVEWIELKGLTYQDRYWPDSIHRHVRDLDVLVRERELDRVVGMLLSEGFVTADPIRTAFSRRRRRLDHAANLVRGELKIDLHWQLRNPGAYRIDMEQVWRESQLSGQVAADRRELSVADDLHLALLSVAHDLQRGACRLKQFLDVIHILRSNGGNIAWNQFWQRRSREATASVSCNSLDVVLRVMGCRFDAALGVVWPNNASQQQVCKHDEQAIRLMTGRRGNSYNHRWFAQCYPEKSWRSIIRFIDRNIACPRRIPWAVIKGYRRLAG